MLTLTCRDRTDGIGAQVCGIISVMVLAASFDMEYVYTPIIKVAHYPYQYPSQRELSMWKNKWEKLFGLNDGYKLLQDAVGIREFIDFRKLSGHFMCSRDGVLSHDLSKPVAMVYGMREAHSVLTQYQSNDKIIKGWECVLPKIRERYTRSLNDKPHFTNLLKINRPVTHIAVHIRRGDSKDTQRRFVQHSYFVNVLNLLIKHLETRDRLYTIHIYSEGDISEFPEFTGETFKGKRLFLHLNDDHFDTLHHFVCADVFVMSKSTFSYLGALYNRTGMIIYKPFWLLPPKPLQDKWIDGGEDGTQIDLTRI